MKFTIVRNGEYVDHAQGKFSVLEALCLIKALEWFINDKDTHPQDRKIALHMMRDINKELTKCKGEKNDKAVD